MAKREEYDLSPLTPAEQARNLERNMARGKKQPVDVEPEETVQAGANEVPAVLERILRDILRELGGIREAVEAAGRGESVVAAPAEAPVAAAPAEGRRTRKPKAEAAPEPEKKPEPEKPKATVVEARKAVLAYAQKFGAPATLAKMEAAVGVKAVADIKDPAQYETLVAALALPVEEG